jgi:signal transduction histidine kinase
MVANAFWLPLFTILISICIGAVKSGELVLQNLQTMVREDEIAARAAAQETIRLKREVAESLHSLQSRVYAARAQGSDQAILADLVSDPDASRSPEEILQSVIEPWASIMEIHVQLPPLPVSIAEARSVKRVMQEGLANAYRHGRASHCFVDISRKTTYLVVSVTDNGVGITPGSCPGLGSAILDSVCPGQWTLHPQPNNGSRLTARIHTT